MRMTEIQANKKHSARHVRFQCNRANARTWLSLLMAKQEAQDVLEVMLTVHTVAFCRGTSSIGPATNAHKLI